MFIRDGGLWVEDSNDANTVGGPATLPDEQRWMYAAVTLRDGSASLTLVDIESGETQVTDAIPAPGGGAPISQCFNVSPQVFF